MCAKLSRFTLAKLVLQQIVLNEPLLSVHMHVYMTSLRK